MSSKTSLDINRVLAALAKAPAAGMKIEQLAESLGVSDADRVRLRRLLSRLAEQGAIARAGRGCYRPVDEADARPGAAAGPTAAPGAETVQETDPEPTAEIVLPAELSPGLAAGPAGEPAPGPTSGAKSGPTSGAKFGPTSEPASKSPGPPAPVDPARTGRITVHPAGYGFVEPEDGSDTVFVPANARGRSLDGDRVVVDLWPGYKGTEGRVVEVLSRGRAKLTGTLLRAGHAIYCEPDDPRIATDHGRVPLIDGAPRSSVGQAAVIEICHYPTEARPELVGRLLRVLGKPDDPRTEIEKILAFSDLPTEFPEDVGRGAAEVPAELRPIDMTDRVDLRDRQFVTIDPETARDFDDALCIEDGPHGGPRVWVAVADVSHYVPVDGAIDREATVRGVSVYLPDRVVPMLPFPLSAGICSLNPEVDRCAMVVRLDLSRDGRIVERDFAAAVIRSHARLDYPGVAAALSGDFRGRRDAYRPWAPALRRLDALAQSMRRRRQARGSLELSLPEARVILDQDDPQLVRNVVRAKSADDVKQAYELVEEFMIAANEAVGGFFAERNLPTVWRVHAPPDPERLRDLVPVLKTFGIKLDEADVEAATQPVGMRRILDAIGEQAATPSLSYLVLRSLKQAMYDTKPIGHFGLASPSYLHFTSPIRRYADLLVHRLLKHHLHRDGKPSGGGAHIPLADLDTLTELAAAVSQHERRAAEAEREAVAMYRAYLMRQQVGERFTGRISAVTHFGAFVEIDEPYVEGLIKLDAMGADAFGFDAVSMRLRGRRSGLRLRLGDPLTVEVTEVSVARRRVDLRLVSANGRDADHDDGEASGGRDAAPARGGGTGAEADLDGDAPAVPKAGFWEGAPGRRRRPQGQAERADRPGQERGGRSSRGRDAAAGSGGGRGPKASEDRKGRHGARRRGRKR
jgi:ribonuclease R